MTKKFNNKYRIESTRLKGWDYSKGGKYFITILTKNREHFFGEINQGIMVLNETGKIVQKCWNAIPQHFSYTWLDEFVIMPNHIHGIIVMKRKFDSELINCINMKKISVVDDGKNVGDGTVMGNNIDAGDNVNAGNFGVVCGVETPNLGVSTTTTTPVSSPENPPKKKIPNYGSGSLGVIINQFKRAVTMEIKYNHNIPEWGWQSRFYDEIIKNDDRLHVIRKYIQNNPANWEKDQQK